MTHLYLAGAEHAPKLHRRSFSPRHCRWVKAARADQHAFMRSETLWIITQGTDERLPQPASGGTVDGSAYCREQCC